ncbi:MAG: SusC/RagA family TonB-linked outer membrane protein [Bacteroidales bacterium]|nr:SusC/RagA family TonB-linked outer membrane protein [Bacteroidales bacterium]
MTFVLKKSLLGLCLVLFTKNLFAQNLSVRITKKDIRVEEVINIIEKKIPYIFFFSEDEIDINKKIDVNLINPSIKDVIKQVFGDDFKYRIINNNTIVVSPDDKKQQAPEVAKEYVITGTIIDSKKQPVPFANVIVKNTTIGVASDFDGKYKLITKEYPKSLVFSCIGFEDKEIAVKARSVIDVALNENAVAMDEVVVVAYGTVKKNSYTGTVSKISSETLKAAATISPVKAVSGAVSGVRISQTSGQPGSGISVQVRGIGSITGNTQPLYVLDGIPIVNENYSSQLSSDPLALLNPEDIENISILKDAAATSLYGSRAANGVVIITTKSGKKGETQISASVEHGYSDYAMPGQKHQYLDAQGLAGYSYEAIYNRYLYDNGFLDRWDYSNPHATELIRSNKKITKKVMDLFRRRALLDLHYKTHLFHPDDPQDGSFRYDLLTDAQLEKMLKPKDYDWADKVLRVGKVDKCDVVVQGGNGKVNYYSSLGYFNQEGIVIGSGFKRFTGKLAIKAKINNWFDISFNESLSHGKKQGQSSGGRYHSNPMFALCYLNPTARFQVEEKANPNPGFNAKYPNPITELDLLTNYTIQNRSLTNLQFNVKFTDFLSFKSTNAIDYTIAEDNSTGEKESVSIPYNGYVLNKIIQGTDLTSSNLVTFRKQYDVHNLSVIAGAEINKYNYKDLGLEGSKVANNDLLYAANITDISLYWGGLRDKLLISYLSKLDYNYSSKYYLGLSFRRDGSSKLSPENRWGNFYSISGGWIVSNESFMKYPWLDFAKLKVSYGTTGNLPQDFYPYQHLYSNGEYNGNPTLFLQQYYNKNLTWEYSKAFNIGANIRFLSRYNLSFEYYTKKTTGLLNYREVSGTVGIGRVLVNRGGLINNGIELDFAVKILKDSQIKWDFNFNSSWMKAYVSKLDEPSINNPFIYKEGENLYSFYLRKWAGVDPDNGLPMWYDANGNKTYNFNKAPRKVVGKGYPDFYGGITNKLSYKNFDLSFLITYSLGADLYNPSSKARDGVGLGRFNIQKNFADHWIEGKSESPRALYDPGIANPDYSNAMTSRVLIDGDYLRLKNILIAYNLNNAICKKMKMKGVRIYFNATDLFTWFKYDHLNPEVGNHGVIQDENYFPLLRSFKLGLNIKI